MNEAVSLFIKRQCSLQQGTLFDYFQVKAIPNKMTVYDGIVSKHWILHCVFVPLQDSGFLDGAFESQNAALVSLSHLLYDELVKSILRIVEKLDLSVQKVTTGEEVRSHSQVPL